MRKVFLLLVYFLLGGQVVTVEHLPSSRVLFGTEELGSHRMAMKENLISLNFADDLDIFNVVFFTCLSHITHL